MLKVIFVSALALASALVVAAGKVSYAGSDPRGALLTAQALIEHGTFALDAYPDFPSSYKTIERAGHRFYSYPPGTPLLAVPAVAVARLAGLDMTREEDDERVQRVLAAMTVGATAILASCLALRWFAWPPAVALGATFVLATPVISTMGTALWSINATVVTTLGALLLLSGREAVTSPARAAAAGVLFGLACWCRPPAVIAGAVVVTWMAIQAARTEGPRRRHTVTSAAALAATFAAGPLLLVLMSRATYGTWLPDYYAGAPGGSFHRFLTALTAHLVSPGRGLLVFAPPLALAAAALVLRPRRILAFPLALPALAWVALHLLLASRFPVWWAGYSYGPRLLVDILPAAFVVLCAAAPRRRAWRIGGALALALTAAMGVWINAVQGLFNPATAAWNVVPDVNTFPGYALDWRLPQFLATDERLVARVRRHDAWAVPPLEFGVEYPLVRREPELRGGPATVDVASYGSSVPHTRTSVRFLVSEQKLGDVRRILLTVALDADRPVSGRLCLNERPLLPVALDGGGSHHYAIAVDPDRMRTMGYDVLQWNVLEWCDTVAGGHEAPILRSIRIAPVRIG